MKFQGWSNFIDEITLLRGRLGQVGLSHHTFKARCQTAADKGDGLAFYSRFPLQGVGWELYGIIPSHCAAGIFFTYNQVFGTQTIQVAFGDTSLMFGNTHYPTTVTPGYPDGTTAAVAFGTRTSQAMNASPFAFLMSGDFNAGRSDPSDTGPFAGLMSSPETVTVVDDQFPGIISVNVPDPDHHNIDHMLFKETSYTAITPLQVYFRKWDCRGILSDHLPKVTLYDVQ